MYERTNIPRTDRHFDSGIKSYLTNDDYETLQRTFTEAEAQSISPHPESELAAPYLAPAGAAYEAVEYGWPPGLDLPFFDVDWPDSGEVPDVAGDRDTPWSVVFQCANAPCYVPGETTCFRLACTQDIIGIGLPISPPAGFSVGLVGHKVCVSSPEGATQTLTIDAIMQAAVRRRNGSAVVGTHSGIRIAPCDDACSCTGIAWDTATSAETVARSASCTVAITATGSICGPYSWSVSGTGFTLDHAVTTGLSNTLNADGTACGSAVITVTACSGGTATGGVRCTTGSWVADGTCTFGDAWYCTSGGSAWQEHICYETAGSFVRRKTIRYNYKTGCGADCSQCDNQGGCDSCPGFTSECSYTPDATCPWYAPNRLTIKGIYDVSYHDWKC